MAQIRTTCPRCKSPVTAEVQQLIDVGQNPQLKQALLGGGLNMVNCPNCGYQGALSTPIVYHDPDKELLLTYFPPELGLPINEQEKQIGPLITAVVNHLPPEKRKAYLFRPQTMLTYQTLVEKVLEGEGITKEMIEGQQRRLRLLQRLLSTPQADDRKEIIGQEEEIVDETFFGLLSRLMEATLAQGDEQMAQALSAVQNEAMENSKVGQTLKGQAEEAQAALRSLQEASKTGLTREKLLDLIVEAPSETRLNTLVSLTRNGLDYNFFQILSERIDSAEGDQKQKLTDLRTKLIDITSKIDKQVQAQVDQSRKVLDAILNSANVQQATEEHLAEIDEFFMEALNSELENARKDGNLERIAKLQQVSKVLEAASAPPPEIALVEELMSAESDEAMVKSLEAHAESITPEFLQVLSSLVAQSEQQQPEVSERLQQVYRAALRFSMSNSLKQ